MGLVNKTQITENLSVIIGVQTIDVLKTEHFPFDIQIRFVKIVETNLDVESDYSVFTPEYQLAFMAIYKENETVFKDEEDIKSYIKQLKEIKSLFEFAKRNKQNWFDTALFDGVLKAKTQRRVNK